MELIFIKSKTVETRGKHLRRSINVQTNRHSKNNKFQSIKGVESEKEKQERGKIIYDAVASFSVAREFTFNDV